MKRIACIGSIISLFLISKAQATTVGELLLAGQVPSVNRTTIKQYNLNSNQLKWIVSSQLNSEHLSETQKFEIEGLDQAGMNSHIKKVESKDHTIQYEILIKHVANPLADARPIFFKITAN